MIAHRELQIPPWGAPNLWRDINAAMAHTLHRHGRRLEAAVDLAWRVKHGIADLDAAMEDLCSQTCPGCVDSCCQRAMIWYDFKDLVYLHLTGAALPETQIQRPAGRPCPNQGVAGCTLPRTARPFICTWYLCPAQKSVCGPAGAGDLIARLTRLKHDRRRIDNLFINAAIS